MLETHYANALASLSRLPGASAKTLAEGLKVTLTRRGHLALLPRIIAAMKRAETREQGKRTVVARIAEAHQKSTAVTKAKELAASHGAESSDIEIVEDESLIAGFAVEGPGFRYDASSRAALMNLYRTLAK